MSFATLDTFSCHALIPKRRPRTEVLAPLTPFDFKARFRHYPDGYIAGCAQTLVLGRNDARATFSYLIIMIVIAITCGIITSSAPFVGFSRNVACRGDANASSSAHDTVPISVAVVDTGLLLL